MMNDNPSSIPKLCRHFYEMGCMTASGGALSMKYGDNIVITPSGLQKEKVTEDDLFMLNQDGKVLVSPSKNLKPSSCLPNFMHLYEIRDAQVAFHLHSKNAVLASILHKGTHLKISNLHVIKAIKNGVTGEHYKFTDTVSVPIIENRDDENDIQANLSEALRTNPECHAVIIRGHGYYVWGKNYKETKIMCEAFEYLFDMANKMKLYGVENVL